MQVPVDLRPLGRPVPATLRDKFGLAFLDLQVGLDGQLAGLTELSPRTTAISLRREGSMTFDLPTGMGVTPIPVEKAMAAAQSCDGVTAEGTTIGKAPGYWSTHQRPSSRRHPILSATGDYFDAGLSDSRVIRLGWFRSIDRHLLC